MEAPFFSIILPTYNRSTRILDTINSVIRQSFASWELVIIDDGSLSIAKTSGLQAALDGKSEANRPESIIVAAGDETTAITVGTGKVEFQMPYAFTLTAVRATVTTAPTTSGTLTVDINEGGTSILSTKLTIDPTEKTSTSAATAAVISDTALADGGIITVDVDAISGGATEAGLKIYLIGYQA